MILLPHPPTLPAEIPAHMVLGWRIVHPDLTSRGGFRWGFPEMDRIDFMIFWLRGHGHRPERMSLAEMETTVCRRIAWRYLDGEATDDR